MFARLFAASGLSLDRLRSLLEVGAAGSIAKAAAGDPVKQSQYSRQIKELEDFFAVKLVERHGRELRLTANGKELARIGRFFLLGLSNFQRGCRREEQVLTVGAGATFLERFVIPLLAGPLPRSTFRFAVETIDDDEAERRLQELTLDFAIVAGKTLGRPLQCQKLGEEPLHLWVPRALHKEERDAVQAFRQGRLPMAVAAREGGLFDAEAEEGEPSLVVENFLQAAAALKQERHAAWLPAFMSPEVNLHEWHCLRNLEARGCSHHLAWNPRLLRLNSRAARVRDFLAAQLSARLRPQERQRP